MWFASYTLTYSSQPPAMHCTILKRHPLVAQVQWQATYSKAAKAGRANARVHLVSYQKLTDEDLAALKEAGIEAEDWDY